MQQILIKKADGTEEAFESSKLRKSLKRSGASYEASKKVIKKIENELKNGMTTSEIYEHAFKYLEDVEKKPVAARYSMKRAVLALGPSGYPFENFIAELLKAKGYKNVRVSSIVSGKCVEHEIDILAEYKGKHIVAEVKFHNKLGITSDLKVALYVHARFEDIKKREQKKGKELIDEGWLITNTRFSSNAIKYGKCVGMKMMSWNYPKGAGLLDLIEETGVHPITALTTLTQTEKNKLLQKEVVLCRNLGNSRNTLESIGLKGQKLQDIMKESSALCKI